MKVHLVTLNVFDVLMKFIYLTTENSLHIYINTLIAHVEGICRKCYLFNNAQIMGNGTVLEKNYFKTKSGYPILT